MPICFLKTSPLFLNSISKIFLSSFKLVRITTSSNLKWDIHIKDIVHRANVSMSLLKLLNKFNPPFPFFKDLYFVRPLSVRILNVLVRFGILASAMMNQKKIESFKKSPENNCQRSQGAILTPKKD